MTTQFGGKVWISLLQPTEKTGRANLGTRILQLKRAPIQTQDLQHLPKTVLPSHLNSSQAKVFQ